MRSATNRLRIALVFINVMLAAAGCDDGGTGPSEMDPENVAPTLEAIADPTVIRNTLQTDTVEIELDVLDPDDDSLAVTVDSGDGAAVPDTTFVCGAGPCVWSFVPPTAATAHVDVTVTVEDSSGASAVRSIVVHIVPRLVTTTESSGVGSLRRAIFDARSGDVIGFDTEGVFGMPSTITLGLPLTIDEALTIEGPGADLLTISGNNSGRVFRIQDGADVALLDLTIADGKALLQTFDMPGGTETFCAGGGALVAPGSTLSLLRVSVRGNRALCAATSPDEAVDDPTENGGGIANLAGTLDIVDCDITDNTSGFGGGVSTISSGVTSIETSTITDNGAYYGGGVMQSSSTVVIRASSISNNTASLGGGGIVNTGTGFLQITEGIVEHNKTFNGGGIFTRGTLVLMDAPVIANEADGWGGGLYVGAGKVTVTGTSCLIIANFADADENGGGEGGGIYLAGGDIRDVPATRVCFNSPDDIVM